MLSPITTVIMYYPIKTLINFTVIFGIAFFEYRRLHKRYKSGLITKRHGIAKWILVFYIEVLYFMTVFGRRTWSYYRYNFEIGWSYRHCIETGDISMLKEILLNILIFVPVGILAAYVTKERKFIKPICLGIMITVTIECLQLIMCVGYFEFDDMINNVIGVVIGAIPVAGYYYKFRRKIN